MEVFSLIIFLLSYTTLIHCNIYNYGNEELSTLILAVADDNGNLASNKNGWLSVDNTYIPPNNPNNPNNNNNNPSPNTEDISFIIPSLTSAWNNGFSHGNLNAAITSVEQEYGRIYNLAMQTYKKYFNNDSENQDNIIDKYDIIKFLTTNVGGKPIGLFDSSINKEIYYPVNDNVYKDFVDAVKYKYGKSKFKGILELDTNNNLNLLNPPFEVMYEIAHQCNISPNCLKYFEENDPKVNKYGTRKSDKNDGFYLSDVNFNIVKSEIADDNGNMVTRYHLFTADNSNKKNKQRIAHQFAIKYDDKKRTWEKDSILYQFKERTYSELAKNLQPERLNDYGKTYQNNGVVDSGIGIFAESDIKFTYKGKTVYATRYRDTNNRVKDINKEYRYSRYNNIHINRSDSQYKEIETLIEEFISMNGGNIIAQKRALNLLKILSLIKLFPINGQGEFLGLSAGRGHPYELSKLFNAINTIETSMNNQGASNCRIVQRKRGNKLINCPCNNFKINKPCDIKDNLNQILEKFT